jgi:hypothetical protein
MRYIFFSILAILFLSCDNHSFDSDKRQIMAKDEIRHQLHGARAFDINGFKEDTLSDWPDSNYKNPIRYSLNIVYKDSTGAERHRTGVVIFTPDGKSIISSQITGPQP